MSVRRSLFAAATASILALAMAPASAQTLRYANQGDLKSLDPYTLNESTTHAHHGQEVGRGEQRRRAHARRSNDAELCLAQRQRHRRLHYRKPSAGRQDRVQGQSELVAQARA